jgi:hypothetical protein
VVPADHHRQRRIARLEAGGDRLDDVDVAGEAGDADQGWSEPVQGPLDVRLEAGVEDGRPMPVELQCRAQVFEGQGLEEVDPVEQRLTARRLDEQHVHVSTSLPA